MLKIIEDSMCELGLNYAFMRWEEEIDYPYFVGEYSEVEPLSEDGLKETDFILTGWHRGGFGPLLHAKQQIEEYFNPITGHVVTTDNSAVAIFYANGFAVPAADSELKKLEIHLSVKEWRVI